MAPNDASAATPESVAPAQFRTGFVAIVGRPNVGKSTLTNALVGQKVSITADKAQTTRHRIHGILTTPDTQFVFVDTPGYQTKHGGALNRSMNRAVMSALSDVDCIVWVVEALRYGAPDQQVLRLLPKSTPVVLVISKTDLAQPRDRLLPFIQKLAADGVTQMAECGPGRVLAGLAKRIDGNVKCLALTDVAALEAARGAHALYTDVWTSMGQEAEREQFLVHHRLRFLLPVAM